MTDATAFAVLLTVESLLFATLSAASSIDGKRRRKYLLAPENLGRAVTALIFLVALCAALMWTSVFAEHMPSDARGVVVAIVLLIALVAQPVFALSITVPLKKQEGKLPPSGNAG